MKAEDFKERCSNLFDFFDGGDLEDSKTGLLDIRLFNFFRNLMPDTFEAFSTYLQEKNEKIGDEYVADLCEEFWDELVRYRFCDRSNLRCNPS
jgi:hypothetical protein